MAKRKRSINDSVKSEYPFINGVKENAEWTLCNVKFCIAYGGRSDVVNHMKTKKKHKLAVQKKASSNSINNYLSTKNISVPSFLQMSRVLAEKWKYLGIIPIQIALMILNQTLGTN
jgi:hypothetical protein